MARKLELIPGKFQWGTEKCEDVVLIDGYLRAKPYFVPELTHFSVDFETNYFANGWPVGWHHMDQVNAVLRRKNLETVEFRETQIWDYGKTRGPDRAAARRALLAQIEQMGNKERAEFVTKAREQMDCLPEPSVSHEEYKAQKAAEAQRPVPPLRRLVAPAAKSALSVNEAAKLLNATQNPDLLNRVVAKVDDSELLKLIEMIESPVVRDLLIEARLSNLG